MIKTLSFLFLTAGLCARQAVAAEPPAIELREGQSVYPVAKAQILVDPDGKLSIDDVRAMEENGTARWAPVPKFNFGYTTARLWLKMTVANASSPESDWLLQYHYPLIQALQFYQFTGGKQLAAYKTGRLLPFHSRPISYHNYLFDFAVPQGTPTELYVMVESVGTVFAPMSICTKEALLTQSAGKTTAIGIYVGIILAMVLYNFFLFTTIRDRNYLYYIAYAATFCLLLSSLNGMTYQYLWPKWVGWNKVSVPVIVGTSYLFLALFTQSFLDLKRLAPRWNWGLYPVFAGCAVLIGGGLFSYGLFVNRFTSLFIFLAPVIVIPISARCVMLGSPAARYYLIAFGCFFLGSATHAARDLGWLPANFATENGPYLGSAAEMILLSLGLAARIKLLKEDKLRSELQVAEKERQLIESREKLERQLAVSALASQVAHDIKSPLAALAVVEKDLSQLGEETRILLRSAVGRIRDIANNLIETNREIKASIGGSSGALANAPASPAPTVELLSSHVDSLITEKRLQFRAKGGVEIEARLGAPAYGLFARIVPSEFKRDLSNLINNAVEAVGENGKVGVDLNSADGRVILKVQDSGRGISPELLPRLGRRGVTSGKPGGLGLGLYHAKANLESWGGTLDIQSKPGAGTTVFVGLPKAQPPGWFAASLELEPDVPVVVLDDDSSIHQVWQSRLDSMRARDQGVEALHFSAPFEFRSWTKRDPRAKSALFLMDYELAGHKETGLSLIEELGLRDRAILVTSHSDEKDILAECLRLDVRMIPKGLAGFVPIAIRSRAAERG